MGVTNRKANNLTEDTFGKRIEEIILVRNLNKYGNRKIINKVGSIINRFKFILNQLKALSNYSVKMELAKESKKKYLNRIDSLQKAHPDIKSFAKNVLTIYFKDFEIAIK